MTIIRFAGVLDQQFIELGTAPEEENEARSSQTTAPVVEISLQQL